MIKINLASRKQSHLVSEPASDRSNAPVIGKTRFINLDELRGLPFRKFIIPAIFCFVLYFTLDGFKKDSLQKVEKRFSKLNQEKEKLTQTFNQTKIYEEMRKNLEVDELTIRRKLEAVKKLVLDRTTPPKVLLALSKSMPEEVWLTEFTIRDADVSIKGSSLGFTQISDFMKNLNESIYFQDLVLKSTQQIKADTGHDIAIFELALKRRMNNR